MGPTDCITKRSALLRALPVVTQFVVRCQRICLATGICHVNAVVEAIKANLAIRLRSIALWLSTASSVVWGCDFSADCTGVRCQQVDWSWRNPGPNDKPTASPSGTPQKPQNGSPPPCCVPWAQPVTATSPAARPAGPGPGATSARSETVAVVAISPSGVKVKVPSMMLCTVRPVALKR